MCFYFCFSIFIFVFLNFSLLQYLLFSFFPSWLSFFFFFFFFFTIIQINFEGGTIASTLEAMRTVWEGGRKDMERMNDK